ncbi:MAG: FAD-dependent oxidoreductase [Planctomycetota bacterium]
MAEPSELHTPILVVGGGTGGIAAALAIARRGGRCIVAEPTDWVGGQLTSQAVPPDENRWIEASSRVAGANASYLAFREGVRAACRQRNLTPAAHADPELNPGGGWVSRLCCEPATAHIVLMAMLAPHLMSGAVRVLHHHRPVAAEVRGDRIHAVTFDTPHGERLAVSADQFLDASELGDLLQLAEAEHRIGAESQSETGELHARTGEPDPTDLQGPSWVFALEHRPGEDHTIDRPSRYGFWRDWVPPVEPAWPGPLLSWTCCDHAFRPRLLDLVPPPDTPEDDRLELWRYRRIVDPSLYAGPDRPPDVTSINCVQMDYFEAPTLGVSPEAQARAFDQAKQLSRCFLYWMQTEAPRHDGGQGYPGLKLRGDELGTADGFAKAPYIREARRLEAIHMLSEADLGDDQRRAAGFRVAPESGAAVGEPFPDAVAIGHYPIDLHPTPAGRNAVYVPACPFRVPLRSLIPVRIDNLMAAGKCLGVTHIANGATRLHPVEWAIGEAAGEAATLAVERGESPRGVALSAQTLAELLERLDDAGVPLAWPWDDAAAPAVTKA